MPTNASSTMYFQQYLVGSSGPTGIPGLISHIAASSAAFTAADIATISNQLMGIYTYFNDVLIEAQHGQKRSS